MIDRTLPIRTVSEANRRGHWAKHAKRTADQRRTVKLAFQSAVVAAKLTLPLRVRIVRIAPRALDGHDNLCAALKACADGITDALGLKSDRANGLTFEYDQQRGAPKTYGVRITLTRGDAWTDDASTSANAAAPSPSPPAPKARASARAASTTALKARTARASAAGSRA